MTILQHCNWVIEFDHLHSYVIVKMKQLFIMHNYMGIVIQLFKNRNSYHSMCIQWMITNNDITTIM